MKCVNCHHENSQGNIFCEKCGTTLTEPNCSKCGAEHQQRALFCPMCGQSYGQPKTLGDNTQRVAKKQKRSWGTKEKVIAAALTIVVVGAGILLATGALAKDTMYLDEPLAPLGFNPNGSNMVASDGWVYFNYQGLQRMSEDGLQIETIYDNGVDSLNVVNGWIYFVGGYDVIYKMRTDGSQLQEFLDPISLEEDYILDESSYDDQIILKVAGDWVYFSVRLKHKYKHDDQMNLYRIRTDGSRLAKVDNREVHDFTIDNDWLYIYFGSSGLTGKSEWVRMRADGSDRQLVGDDEDAYTGYFGVVIDDWVYKGSTRTHIDADGKSGIVENICEGIQWSISDGWIYWTTQDESLNGPIYKTRIDGTDATLLMDFRTAMFTQISVARDWIFVDDRINGTFLMRTDGSNIIQLGSGDA